MGEMTHAQLVSEALELAGNTGLTTRAQAWLGLVIRRLHEQFGFPQQDAVAALLTVQGGTSTFTVGGTGADLFANVAIRGVKQVFLADGSSQDDWEELTPAPARQMSIAALDQGIRSGRPQFFTAAPGQDRFTVALSPVPDRAYRLFVLVDGRAPAFSAYSAGQVNYYPDDWTVLQGIYAFALKHQNDERADVEMKNFEKMAKEDRVRYGNMNNDYKVVKLGGPHVAAARDKNRGPGWMGPV